MTTDDEMSVLDPVVTCPKEILELLKDMNGSVFIEVLVEKLKTGITERQLLLLESILFQSNS